MIDRLLSLASTVQSNKGAYAVLAGSGVSRAAGIPTGYEVMLDLIRRIARAEGAHCEPDPEAWFQATYGVSPAYPTLLDALAASDVERQQLLRGYFEPTDEERGRGIKLPTYAHRAIAGLMAQGYVRVVVTTNFDRLFEQALAERGITPTVVSTPDQVEGIQPLPHVRQLLIKVHGDYLDTRMKNTPEELEGFDPRLEALVQRVFEEFGLVICGWSAEYDTALRRSLERCSARWFGVYWATRGKATPTVSRLTEQSRARLITIRDADSFFVQLLDKVVALEQDGAESPQSVEVDVARIKKYLSDDRYRIELADLVRGEVKRTILVLNDERVSPDGELPTRESFPTKMGQYERAVERLLHLLGTGCFWGEANHLPHWLDSIAAIASRPQGLCPWPDYPAVLLCYAAGIGAVAAERYETLVSLMISRPFKDVSGKERPAALVAHADTIPGTWMEFVTETRATRDEKRFSLHLHKILRSPLDAVVSGPRAYDAAFDLFECLNALIYYSLASNGFSPHPVSDPLMPLGRFAWHDVDRAALISRLEREVEEQRDEWCLVRCGLFHGDYARAMHALGELRKQAEELSSGRPGAATGRHGRLTSGRIP